MAATTTTSIRTPRSKTTTKKTPAAKSSPSKTAGASKAKSAKTAASAKAAAPSSSHPSWKDIIKECIAAHTSEARSGVSRSTIKKFAEETYKLEINGLQNSQLNRAIASGAEQGIFTLPKGTSGKVKLAPKVKTNVLKENNQPPAPKKTAAPKAAVKETAARKAPTKRTLASGKPAAAKKTSSAKVAKKASSAKTAAKKATTKAKSTKTAARKAKDKPKKTSA